MKSFIKFYGAILIFGVIGAIAANLLFMLWTQIYAPKLFGDGQYWFVFFFYTPLGWLIGSVIGFICELRSKTTEKPSHPYLFGIVEILAGIIITPVQVQFL